MHILFIYSDFGNFNVNNFNRGVAMLSACLKQKGYQTSLIHITSAVRKEKLTFAVANKRPDIIAFSSISHMFPQTREFVSWFKDLKVPMILGGAHPSVAPEECLGCEGVTAICLGEGEGALLDYCRAVENKESIAGIPNLWVKENGRIYKNACRPLSEDLDILPFPDYELFNYARLDESLLHRVLVTQASRGCLYDCSYCCNPLLRSLYPNKDKYLRFYKVDRILDEIEAGLKAYPFLKEVRFYDDTLAQDKVWFDEFSVKYKQRIGLPYACNERVENIDAATAGKLKASGCVSVDLGVESGSEQVRRAFMNRHMSDSKIIEAFAILRKYGIKGNSFNILGMAGETPDTLLETVKLNARVSPSIVFNAYFHPFAGTRAYALVKEKGYKIKEGVKSLFDGPVVELPAVSRQQLQFFYKYFYSLMKVYRLLWKVFGRNSGMEKIFDKLICSPFFPHQILSFFHLGKEDLMSRLRGSPGAYLFFRSAYRKIRNI